jgi:uncharacterized protein YwqG
MEIIKKIQNTIESMGMGAYWADIEPKIRRSIGLELTATDENELPLGASKMGGCPDVPPDFVYPKWKGQSLPFVAQFNLEEVAPFDKENHLPKSGILYFFFNDEGFGLAPEDKGASYIYHFQGDTSALQRLALPDDVPISFNAAKLSFTANLDLPSHNFIYDLVNDEENIDEMIENYFEHFEEGNKLFGNPHYIQGEVESECEYGSKGLEFEQHDPKEVAKWQLLLQVDSNNQCNMMWGDLGCIFFCIKQEDLEAHKWENHWAIMQCG